LGEDALFEVLAGLKRDRAAIIYITHFIDEIFAICERVTVMRKRQNGRIGPYRQRHF